MTIRKSYLVMLLLIVLGVGCVWGAATVHFRLFPFSVVRAVAVQTGVHQPKIYEGREQIACPRPEDTLVVFGFGQSNSTNNGGQRFQAKSDRIINFVDGRCYRAKDPMLGGSGHFGSIWVPLAERLATEKAVLMVTVGAGGTTVKEWLSDPVITARFDNGWEALRKAGYPVDYFIWIQGESDVGTDPKLYERDLRRLVGKALAKDKTARFGITSTSHPDETAIATAQKVVATSMDQTLWLGNTNQFYAIHHRYDGLHLSKDGIIAVADLIAERLNTDMRSR